MRSDFGGYGKQGAEGLKHRSAGKVSNRAKPEKFRKKVLRKVRAKYWGEEGKRFGPTLAAEHLAAEDGLTVDHETLRRWMLREGCGAGRESDGRIDRGESGESTLASWSRWMEVSMTG